MVELLAQGARFYELLGYILAVLAVGILLAGVLWSLRLHVPQQYRALFVVAGCAVLLVLCGSGLLVLVWSQPIAPAPLTSPASRLPLPEMVSDERPPPSPTAEIDVEADGSVQFREKPIPLDQLAAELRREYPDPNVIVKLRINSEAPIGHAHKVLLELQAHEFKQFQFEATDDGEPLVGDPAERGVKSKSR